MHRLDGPRAKIERANRQIITLQQSVQGFFRDNLYEIRVAERKSKAGNYPLRVKSGPQEFPVDWSVLIGEITYNLRSALDGLTWQLALLWSNPPSFHTSFPICLDRRLSKKIGDRIYPAFDACKKPRGCLQSIPSHLWTGFEPFQPYKRGNRGRHSPLVLLNELNNTDKHRLITVLIPSVTSVTFSGLVGHCHFNRRMTLRTNAKIGWVTDVPPNQPGQGGVYRLDLATMKLVEPKMEVNVTVAPGIRFGHSCKAVERLPLILTLRRMADEVSRVIESFSDKFPK
jgi:hypothetical protein